MKVLFVCLGNIYHVDDQPDPRTVKNALKNGVQIKHRGRQIKPSDLEQFDLILAMDRANYNGILELTNAVTHAHKVQLIRNYDPHGGEEVPDPYYGGEREFQEVFDILNRSIDSLIESLKKN